MSDDQPHPETRPADQPEFVFCAMELARMKGDTERFAAFRERLAQLGYRVEYTGASA